MNAIGIIQQRREKRISRSEAVPFGGRTRPVHNRNGWPCSEFSPECARPKGI